ncbi:MAG: tetratricopeptide repeat protein [Polyangiaceae bacterium]|nr:tetratricopeptide repeat protein [Polyangiaceae bacterium]
MQDRDPPAPPSSHEVAGEDFLFHLYRGSELLQDNRVHDAKAELEQALRFQPSDPKGQDLLGIVYFRLGLYPRAIAIYEQLVQSHPDAIEPRVNLALSYIKTGQAAAARSELERVVEQNPNHSRAWGYLGLAFQRLGDYERASHAFAAGGHDAMARRLLEMATQSSPGVSPTTPASLAPEPLAPRESRRPTAPGFEAATGGPTVSVEMPASSGSVPTTAWTAIDADVTAPAEAALEHEAPPPSRAALMPPPARLPTTAAVADEAPRAVHLPRTAPPTGVRETFQNALLVYPRALPVALHPSGIVLVQAASGFAARLESVRSMTLHSPAGEALRRRVRGRVIDESLGGSLAPIIDLPGKSEIIFSPQKDHDLSALTLDDDALYLREDALLGFEPGVSYENGRLPVGDGDAIAMVQLRGSGTLVAQLPATRHAVEVMEGHTLLVRAACVLAWFGRLLPRGIPPSEAPAGARGLAAFSGEGMVLLDGRA